VTVLLENSFPTVLTLLLILAAIVTLVISDGGCAEN
jgi:hypothetical protein